MVEPCGKKNMVAPIRRDMELFEELLNQSVDRNVQISYGQLSKITGLPIRTVRDEIRRLAENGHITITRVPVGDSRMHRLQYTLLPFPNRDSTSVIKILYCELASDRSRKTFDPLYNFNGYSAIFSSISVLCDDEEMNSTMYMLSIFNHFPELWCNKTFKKPYPPPYVFLNKKNAKDRYDGFMRFIYQHAEPEKIVEMKPSERLKEELRVWKLCGSPRQEMTLNMMVDNGTISKSTLKHIMKGKE